MAVYKRAESPYWLIEFSVDGDRFRRSSGTTNKRIAKQIERKLRQDAHSGALGPANGCWRDHLNCKAYK